MRGTTLFVTYYCARTRKFRDSRTTLQRCIHSSISSAIEIIGNTDSRNRVTRCKRTCNCVPRTWILCTLSSSIAEEFGQLARIFQNLCEFNKD